MVHLENLRDPMPQCSWNLRPMCDQWVGVSSGAGGAFGCTPFGGEHMGAEVLFLDGRNCTAKIRLGM